MEMDKFKLQYNHHNSFDRDFSTKTLKDLSKSKDTASKQYVSIDNFLNMPSDDLRKSKNYTNQTFYANPNQI